MAKVVMLTAMAGDGIDLQCGDVFETDDATAARLVECGAATAEVPEEKKLANAKKQAPPRVVEEESEEDVAEGNPEGTASEQVPRRVTRRR